MRAHTFLSLNLQQLLLFAATIFIICCNYFLFAATLFNLQQLYFICSNFFICSMSPVGHRSLSLTLFSCGEITLVLIKKITRNSLKVFFCAEEGFKVWTALLLFSVNCKRSLPTPFCEFWHVTVSLNIGMRARRIRPIMRRITLTLTHKKPTYHKHSHMSLRLCRMLEWTFMHLFANGLYKWFRRVCGLAAT